MKWGSRQRARPDCGPPRTAYPRAPEEASTTGAAPHAPVLEPCCFLHAYRTVHATDRRDVTRSLENRMETTTSVPQTREDVAFSLRTSRVEAPRFHGSPKVTMRGRIRVSRPVCTYPRPLQYRPWAQRGPSACRDRTMWTVSSRSTPWQEKHGGKPDEHLRNCADPTCKPLCTYQVERRNEMPVRRKYRTCLWRPTSEAIHPVISARIQIASDQSSSELHPRFLPASIACIYRTAIQEV